MDNPEPEIPREEYQYWAFISHSSKDRDVARWLHRSIETYGIPAQLHSHKTPAGDPAPRRFFPLFYDRDELPAAHSLDERLKQALARSRYLIVICSPHAVQSRYVDWEIREFQRLGRGHRVLALIVDGEPNSGDENECFPPSLRDVEPLAADLRDTADGQRLARLKLIAGMLGIGVDEIILRDRIRRRRKIMATSIVTSLIVLGFIALGVMSYISEQKRQLAQLEADRKSALAIASEERAKAAEANEAQALAEADEERQRAENETLRAEQEQLKTEAERERTEAERQRAETEKLRADSEARRAEEQQRRAEEERVRAEEARRQRYIREYVADMIQAQKLWEQSEVAEMDELLDKYASPRDYDPRGFEWYYLRNRRFGDSNYVYTLPEEMRLAKLSGTYVTVDRDGDAPHSDWRSVTFHPTQNRLAMISARNGSCLIWDFESGREPEQIHKVIDAQYAGKGEHLVTLTLDIRYQMYGQVQIRDGENYKVLKTIQLGTGIPSLIAVQPGGDLLLTSNGAALNIYKIPGGEKIKSIGKPAYYTQGRQHITGLALSPDGKIAAAGYQSGEVEVYDIENNRVIARSPGVGRGAISGVTFSPDGKTVAFQNVGYFDTRLRAFVAGDIKLWEYETDKVRANFNPRLWRILERPIVGGAEVEPPPGDYCPVFSPDGSLVYTTGPRSVQVWNAKTGERLEEISGHSGLASAVAISRDGRYLAGLGENATAIVWPLQKEEGSETPLLGTYRGDIGQIVVWEDERQARGIVDRLGLQGMDLQVVRTGFYQIARWEFGGTSPAPVEKTDIDQSPKTPTPLDPFSVRAKSPDGKWIAKGKDDGSIFLESTIDPELSRTYPTHRQEVLAVAFSPDSYRLVSAGIDRRLCVRNLENGELLASMPGHRREIGALAFSPDGKRLASASGLARIGDETPGEIILWDTEIWAPCMTFQDEAPSTYGGVDFSPDGMRIYASINPLGGLHPGKIIRWSARTAP